MIVVFHILQCTLETVNRLAALCRDLIEHPHSYPDLLAILVQRTLPKMMLQMNEHQFSCTLKGSAKIK